MGLTADGRVTMNFEAVTDVAQAIGTYQGSMRSALDDLYQSFKALFGNDWEGAASQACDEAQQQWNQGANEIQDALNRLGIKLHASVHEMQQTEQHIMATFG